MHTASTEWAAHVAARNEIETAKAQAAMTAWVRRCRASRSAGALARNRMMSVDQVNALEMGARRLMNRHFQRQRNWVRRRAARSACGDSVSAAAAAPHPDPLTPEEELADTIQRQKEEVQA